MEEMNSNLRKNRLEQLLDNRKVKNIIEKYQEDMMNDDNDCLKGTEDSYANEMLMFDLWDIQDDPDIQASAKEITDLYNYIQENY